MKILVIDDDTDILEFINYNLQKEGHFVTACTSGIEAIWSLSQQNIPDLILVDLMMPSPDGFEICNLLKTSEAYKHIPVIVISAREQLEDMANAFIKGADSFIPKPFSINTLLTAVHAHS